MQNSLFTNPDGTPVKKSGKTVAPANPAPALVELAAALPAHLRLGTSSWNYPGWAGLVWDGEYPATSLSRYGLSAYAQHPLFRTVSVDRSFYRPLNVAQYAEYAAQVDQDFRFMVKAPSLVTDALVRDESGRGMRPNPHFLNIEQTRINFIEPALEGLGARLGALVFQISPLPVAWLARIPQLIDHLHRLLKTIPALRPTAPDGVVAVEVRAIHNG